MKDLPIHFEQPLWLLFPVLLVAIAISAFLYYRHPQQQFSTSIKRLLFVLRFAVIAILGILLLNPFLVDREKNIEKPVVVVAVDLSESMLNNQDSSSFTRNLRKITEDLQQGLSQHFKVDVLGFSHQVFENSPLVFTGKRTDIAQLLSYVEDKYYMLNLSALVLLSDGQYNQGINPIHIASEENFQIFPVLIGDTVSHADISIKNLFYNQVVRQGGKFQVGVEIQAISQQGKKLKLQIMHRGKVVDGQSVKIPSESFNHEFTFDVNADEKGMQSYQVRLVGPEKDANETNNTAVFYVQVVEAGNKVLILGSGPHPDLGAIASALRAADGYEVDVKTLNDFPFDMSKYQLVILHGIPAHDERSKRILSDAEMKNKALWYILNSSSDYAYLSDLDIPYKIQNPQGVYEYAQACYRIDFSNFQMPMAWDSKIAQFPQLYVPFSKFQSLRKSDVMLWQTIRGFETDKPLLFFWSKGKRKLGLLAGEGLWKWRFYDFQNNANHETFNTFIIRVSSYLLTGVYQERFHINYQNIYNETDQINWDAQVFNEAYEPVSDADIKLEISDENEHEYPYQFTANNGAYRLNLDYLKAGAYHFHAIAKTHDTSFAKDGKFVVNAWNMERAKIGANVELLTKLAQESGGVLYHTSQLDKIISDLNNSPYFKSRSSFVQKLINLIDLRWLLFVLSTLLGLEWFIRKRNGSY